MLDANIQSQLKSYFTRLTRPIELRFADDDSAVAREMSSLLTEVAALSPLITIKAEQVSDVRCPSFSVTSVDSPIDIRFACVPMGHEFTSFVLAILQAGGHPPKLSDTDASRIRSLTGPLDFEIYISLSCHNCPDVVQALNVLAVLNPSVKVSVIDGALFQDEAKSRGVMAVPTVFKNGAPFFSGRHELSEIIGMLDADAANEAVEAFSNKVPFDVLVVGAGPAGISAAIYAARKGLRTGLIGDRLGGQINETAGIENFTSVIRTEGTKLAREMATHLKSHAVDLITPRRVSTVSRTDDGLWTVALEETGTLLHAKALIAATGARWKKLGVPGEDEFRGHGVAYCPHCDGPLFRDRRVAVIGGGNSGVEAAIDLAGIASHVTLLQRGTTLTADEVLQEKLRTLANVTVRFNALTEQLDGTEGTLRSLTFRNRETGTLETLEIDGCFIQIGLSPNTEWLSNALSLNAYGEIETDDRCRTHAEGLFAAGDCTSVPYKQIVIALGEGAKASLSAFDWLIRQKA